MWWNGRSKVKKAADIRCLLILNHYPAAKLWVWSEMLHVIGISVFFTPPAICVQVWPRWDSKTFFWCLSGVKEAHPHVWGSMKSPLWFWDHALISLSTLFVLCCNRNKLKQIMSNPVSLHPCSALRENLSLLFTTRRHAPLQAPFPLTAVVNSRTASSEAEGFPL